jgi:hypothetical protein
MIPALKRRAIFGSSLTGHNSKTIVKGRAE